MRASPHTLHKATVVAAFENQSDIETAILQLRQAGFRDREIGYFAWHPLAGLKNLNDHTAGREGAIAGCVLGAVFGIWVAPLLNNWFVSASGVRVFLELAVLTTIGASLLFGFLGWEIGAHLHESTVETPATDPADGPFVLAVDADEAREWVWAVVRQNGGYEPHRATAPAPAAV
ncbi:hypothetical protein [Frigoriglobus tundricola]|uniref:DUF3341 domain-containing protein n=1 Tax=Frigoriglobus tundricola TaxID=2774151 RepID=A0A6M5YU66_9BACT|nr:hypothetical protein [Frigoriglobus tundricola]QJW96956.1 hypothetical protein FTUN_4516 [Frigoriglobus tundricola]